MSAADPAARGRSSWGDAFEHLSAARGQGALDAEDLERLAGAAYTAFPGIPDDPPPLEFQASDPDVLRQRLGDAGLEDVRVETTAERPAFRSGQEMWDWVLYGNPIPGMLVAELAPDQRAQLRQVLDGMLRERAGADGRAVLENVVNIGVGTK